ncbi:hypothetical protein Xazr_21205 [Xanthomonas campestris pv. azadirachtae]|nr:hypothetical protein Xazr_21205 [Xanthomonas campestris pv. azadirachtae]
MDGESRHCVQVTIVAVIWIVLLSLSAALIYFGVTHSLEAMRPVMVVPAVEGNPAPVLSALVLVPLIVLGACVLFVAACCLSYSLLARFGRATPSP